MNENENACEKGGPRPPTTRPTSEASLAWLKKHLALAPERDEQWYREVLAIYRAGRRENAVTVAEQQRDS